MFFIREICEIRVRLLRVRYRRLQNNRIRVFRLFRCRKIGSPYDNVGAGPVPARIPDDKRRSDVRAGTGPAPTSSPVNGKGTAPVPLSLSKIYLAI